MKCVRCGNDYIGMKKSNKFNCPHCSTTKAEKALNVHPDTCMCVRCLG